MELWVSISSAVIAVSALGVSIWLGCLQRKHNRLSVLPHITVEFDARAHTDVAVNIKSVGLGPAKFLDYKWVVNDKEFFLYTKQGYGNFLRETGLEKESVEFYCPQINSFLSPGYEGFLIRFPGSASKTQHKSIVAALAGSKIHILYGSMYGEVVHDCHKKLAK